MVHGKVDYQVHAQYMYVNTSSLTMRQRFVSVRTHQFTRWQGY